MKHLEAGRIYTFTELCNGSVELPDSPFLRFPHDSAMQVIQTSHVREDELLSNEKFANSEWRFIRITDEWIPLFTFCEGTGITIADIVDMESQINPFAKDNNTMWVTPKGFPREQHYRIEGESIVDDYGNVYDVPVFDDKGLSKFAYNPGHCDRCRNYVEKRVAFRDPEEGMSAAVRDVCEECKQAALEYFNS